MTMQQVVTFNKLIFVLYQIWLDALVRTAQTLKGCCIQIYTYSITKINKINFSRYYRYLSY